MQFAGVGGPEVRLDERGGTRIGRSWERGAYSAASSGAPTLK